MPETLRTPPSELQGFINDAAQQYGVEPRLLQAVMQSESNFNPNVADGSQGEIGLMQLMPETRQTLNLTDEQARDPRINTYAGAYWLAEKIRGQGGDLTKGVTAYNGTGPDAERYGKNVMALYGSGKATPAPQRGDEARYSRQPEQPPNTVRFIAPGGQLGFIPNNKIRDAIAAGGRPAVRMEKQGRPAYIPADRVQEAVKSGARVVPMQGGPSTRQIMLGGAGGTMMEDIMAPFAKKPVDVGDLAESARVANYMEKAAGHGLLYRTGAGAATGLGENVPAMEQAAAEGKPGEVLGHFGAAAFPYVVGPTAGAMGRMAEPAVKGWLPEKLYGGFTSRSTVPIAQQRQAIQTAIEFNIPKTEAGLGKLNDLIEDWGNKIGGVIQQNPSAPISPGTTLRPIRQLRGEFATQVNPRADVAVIDSAMQEYLDRFRARRGSAVRNMTAAEAQALKQGTYRRLTSRAYGEAKTAQIESEKALARGIKDQLAIAFPEISQLNQQESKFLQLQPLLEHAVNKMGNSHIVNIGAAATGATTAILTGSPTAGKAAGLMRAVLDIPAVRSRLAIALNRRGVSVPVASARIAAYSYALDRIYRAESAARPAPSATQGNSQ